MDLWDYVEDGVNQIAKWTRDLETEERARLRAKLRTLEGVSDPSHLPQFLFGPVDKRYPEIKKLRIGVRGSQTALRPMVCRGPFNKNTEITLLLGAKEAGGKLPKAIAAAAERCRQAIIDDNSRRVTHENI